MNSTIGSRVLNLRKQANLNQEELAKKLSISRSNISKIESDKINPSASNIAAIANYFEVSADYLLFGKDISKTVDVPEERICSEENEILRIWRKLSYANKAIVKGKMYELEKEEVRES